MVYINTIGSFFMSSDLRKRLDLIIESHQKDFDLPFEEMVEDLLNFMKKELKLNRDPKIFFEDNSANAYNILGKTGYYDPNSEEIHVFITKRHPKDILRSIAHELIHHAQVCEGKMKPDQIDSASDENYILHDDHLKNLEEDAFGRGNLIFRKWEAYKKIEISKKIRENFARIDESKKKNKKRKLTTKQYNKAKKMASSMEKKQGYSAEKAHKIAFSQVQKETVDHMSNQKKESEKEVEVNEILKNSHYYRPEDRACNDTYTARDELIFQEMMKKFGIKK